MFDRLDVIPENPDPNEEIHFHVLVTPHAHQQGLNLSAIRHQLLSREELEKEYIIHDEDLDLVAAYYAETHGFDVTDHSLLGSHGPFPGRHP